MNQRMPIVNELENEFCQLIENEFNIKPVGLSTMINTSDNGIINFKARLPTKNRELVGTSYLYTESTRILHFTKLDALFSIINEGALRLYNLHKSNDPEEYSYASNELFELYRIQGIDDEKIERIIKQKKRDSYIFSSTNLEQLYKKKFWVEYADKMKGIAIEFEIINDVKEWELFYSSEVLYDQRSDFSSLSKEWRTLQSKCNKISYEINLDQFLSLHKSKKWMDEAEIRILNIRPRTTYSEIFDKMIYRDIRSYNLQDISYLKLPLCNRDGEFLDEFLNQKGVIDNAIIPKIQYAKIFPRIRIADIHYGSEFPRDINISKFHEDIRHYISEKMKCNIPFFHKGRTKIIE